MKHIVKPRSFSGKNSQSPWEWEASHVLLAQKAAEEGIVLLKNDGILPLEKGLKLALFGSGASRTVKGGTGSGDVNERKTISIAEGLRAAGYDLTTESWLSEYENTYKRARIEWRADIKEKAREAKEGETFGFFVAYSTTPFRIPEGPEIIPSDTDTAIYVISRNSGEGADRISGQGDYLLSDREKKQLSDICRIYKNVIVLVNAGSVIDLTFVDEYSNIRALLLVSQPGMAGGYAVASVIDGDVNPSGHLTDTWAYHYSDYPAAGTFSHNNGNVQKEYYNEGIFVGYRYFDTFNIKARYGFGFGLSYTSFDINFISCKQNEGHVTVTAKVTNKGKISGKDVIQLYASLPHGNLIKEKRRLVAFKKTKLLKPGDVQALDLEFNAYDLASFDEMNTSWIIEPGLYVLYLGESLNESDAVAVLNVQAEITVQKVKHVCQLRENLDEIIPSIVNEEIPYGLPVINYNVETLAPVVYYDHDVDNEAMSIAENLHEKELIALVTGDPGKGQGSAFGSAGISVPGSAGETSSDSEHAGVAGIAMADGPAGLRLSQSYYVSDNRIVQLPFEANFENGFFFEGTKPGGEEWFQYCTAFPVGTMLAQTWNTELVMECGDAVGQEMQTYGITLWLAPGMNIHRDPLCGRNFEYYSEDPLVAGKMAAAITLGVQSNKGCGTTIKHYACNNQEDNRMRSDSIVSERALREIYLRGFGIAIKEAQPMAMMTSYNMINGVHSANNHDLCTDIARCEFGFKGMIMTDWTTTNQGDPLSTASGCIRAGNDLVMPGMPSDRNEIRKAMDDGSLSTQMLKKCAARVIRMALQADRYQ